MRRLGISALVVALGAVVSMALGRPDFPHARWYLGVSTALLAVGLFGSTSAIDLRHLAERVLALVGAVSLGVVAKATMISVVMVAVFRSWESLLLGVAVAQIDPLSVSALHKRGSLSPRGRTFLAAWASFDDPVTVLLTLSLSAVVLSRTNGAAVLPGGLTGGGLGGLGIGFAKNIAFTVALWGLWSFLHRGRRVEAHPGRGLDVAELILLVLALSAAVWQSLLFGLAVAGLFLRPRLLLTSRGERVRDRTLDVAYYLAVVLLGLTLTRGVDLVAGAVLGATAFASQAVVVPLFARGSTRSDRRRLALAQQNGITAILLGLTLEPVFPGILGTVAPAILVINVMHLASTALLDRWRPSREGDGGAEAQPEEDVQAGGQGTFRVTAGAEAI